MGAQVQAVGSGRDVIAAGPVICVHNPEATDGGDEQQQRRQGEQREEGIE